MKADWEVMLGGGSSESERMMSRLSLLDRMAQWQQGWNPRMSMSLTSTKGLLNAPGQNNCFLNSAVQVLWHLDVFRRSFRMLSGHACMGNSCIFCALKVLFTQFQYSDRTSLPPDALRKALAKAFMEQQRFQVGLMDDAAECFENILLRIHFHIANGESEDMCNARHCIPHQKFAMTVVEQIVCQCGATSEPLPFSQTVYYVSASALVSQAKAVEAQGSLTSAQALFAQLVRNAVAAGDVRECPSNCGRKVQIRRNLTNSPDVVSLGLVWDSDRPSLDHIKDVVRCIGTSLRLPDLFHAAVEDTWSKVGALQLVGVVCYYGKHYSTFFFHSKMKKWVYFDDATVKEMGSSWQGVADKCCRGHYQPLLLLYANPDSSPISTETAPQITTMLPGHKFMNSPEEGGGGMRHQHQSQQNHGGGSDGNRTGYYVHETSLRNRADDSGSGSYVRRSMTPNPDSSSERQTHLVQRRAITPGPTWGYYDSDEEEYGRKPEPVHFRQSSYLTAMENISGHSRERGSAPHRDVYANATAPMPSMGSIQNRREPQDSHHISVPKPCYSNTKVPQTRHDGHLHGQPQHAPAQHLVNSHPGGDGYNGSHAHQNKIIPRYDDWTVPGSQQCMPPDSRQPSTGLVRPAPLHKTTGSSVAKVSEIQRIESFKKDQDHRHHQELPQQHEFVRNVVNSNNAQSKFQVGHPQSNLKRTKSLENTVQDDEPDGSYYHRPPVSKTRPQSARPYDYGKQRPVVEQTHRGNVHVDSQNHPVVSQVQPSHQPIHAPRPVYPKHPPMHAPQSGHTNSQPVHAPPPAHHGNQPPHQQVKKSHSAPYPSGSADKPNWEEIMGEDPNATYISRKAVENIMHYQKNRGRPASAGPTRSGAQNSSNSSLESCGRDHATGPSYLRETLKVDIPDNASIRSQSDSGYRSSGSGGDRNSASSASSTSNDSPTNESLRAYGHKDPGKPLFFGSSFEGKSNFSSEGSISGSHKQGQHHLGKIPENLPANDVYNQGHQLVGRGLEDLDSDDEKDLIEFSLAYQGPMKGESCEQLCIRAEGLIEQSIVREKDGDLALALTLCTQAVGLLQQALNLPNTNQDSKLHARVKHNSCVLRSRGLHRRIMSKPDSAHSSDVSLEDHTSISSVSTDTECKDADLIALDQPVKDQYQIMQDRLGELYKKGLPVPPHQTQGVVMHMAQGSHRFHGKQPPMVDAKPHVYTVQYSSDSGYSTTSDSAHTPGLPHSNTDGALNKQLKSSKLRSAGVSDVRNSHSCQVDSDQESNVGVYATLPRKGSKPGRPPSQPPENEIYQVYLQRQKDAQRQQRGSRENLLHQQDHPAPSSGFAHHGNHQSQGSNCSISKQDIKKLLISEFMENRQGKSATDKPEVGPKPTVKPKPNLKPKPEVPTRQESLPENKGQSSGQGRQYEDMLAQQVMGLSVQKQVSTPGYNITPSSVLCPPGGHPRMEGGGNHSRQSSSSSSHTLQAHSRENSLSSLGSQSGHGYTIQPQSEVSHGSYPNPGQGHVYSQGHPPSHQLHGQRPYQAYDPVSSYPQGHAHAEQVHSHGHPLHAASQRNAYQSGNANPVPQGGPHLSPSQHAQLPALPQCPGDVEPCCGQQVVEEREIIAPKPSVIGRLDRQYHQELERLAAQQAERHSQGKTTTGDLPATEREPGSVIQRNQYHQAGQMDPGQKSTSCKDKSGTADAPHTVETFRDSTTNRPSTGKDDGSCPPHPGGHSHQCVDPQQCADRQCRYMMPTEQAVPDQQSFDPSASYQINLDPDFPPPPPCAFVIGGVPDLEAEGHPKSPQHSHPQPEQSSQQPIQPIQPVQQDPKSVLSKRKKGHKKKKHRPRKSVTFSDNIILIGTKEEAPPEIDFIAYVNKLQGNIKRHSTSSSSVTSDLMDESDCTASTISSNSGSSEVNDCRTGYDSDYDEETDDSGLSDDDSDDKIKCNLCRKKYIEMTELYCEACKFYMSQFQPQPS